MKTPDISKNIMRVALLLMALSITSWAVSTGPGDGECCGGTTQKPDDTYETGACVPSFFNTVCLGSCGGFSLTGNEWCDPLGSINAGTRCTNTKTDQIKSIYGGSCPDNPPCDCTVNWAVVLSSAKTGFKVDAAACL